MRGIQEVGTSRGLRSLQMAMQTPEKIDRAVRASAQQSRMYDLSMLRQKLRQRRAERKTIVRQQRFEKLKGSYSDSIRKIGELEQKPIVTSVQDTTPKPTPKIIQFKPMDIKDSGIQSGKQGLMLRTKIRAKVIEKQILKQEQKPMSISVQEMKLGQKIESKNGMGYKKLRIGLMSKSKSKSEVASASLSRESLSVSGIKSDTKEIQKMKFKPMIAQKSMMKPATKSAMDSSMISDMASKMGTSLGSSGIGKSKTAIRMIPSIKSKQPKIRTSKKRVSGRGRKTRYTASLAGIVSGKKTKKPPKILTGLEIRGVNA